LNNFEKSKILNNFEKKIFFFNILAYAVFTTSACSGRSDDFESSTPPIQHTCERSKDGVNWELYRLTNKYKAIYNKRGGMHHKSEFEMYIALKF